MKAKGEIEALKTLTDFRNKPLAMLRGQGSSRALRSPALSPGCPAEGWQRACPTHEGKRFGGTWTLWPSGGCETETPHCPWWSPPRCPGDGRAARSRDDPACRTPCHRPVPCPCLCNTEAPAPELAPHYANGKAFSWARMGGAPGSLGIAVELFKTNLDVATLFL